jgi:Planctomycete cytochrome C
LAPMRTGGFLAFMAGAGLLAAWWAFADNAPGPLPSSLRATGLYAGSSGLNVRPENRGFTPQYPLWSDGAQKLRWISLPPGRTIDASRAAAWDFPRGTKLWKEFSVNGRRIETRLIERLEDGSWRFAAYAWNDDQSDAMLVPAAKSLSKSLPDGRRYTIPSEADCRACHEGAAVPVLGFSALQLSRDRDPLAPHAEAVRAGDLDLEELVARELLVGLPHGLSRTPPRIAAPTPAGRAVLGYLHANCGQCHVDPKLSGSAVPVELQLALDPSDAGAGERTIRTLLEGESRYRTAGAADARLVVPGDPQAGTLLARMRSRDPRIQMPPLGSAVADLEAIVLIEYWIEQDLKNSQETTP